MFTYFSTDYQRQSDFKKSHQKHTSDREDEIPTELFSSSFLFRKKRKDVGLLHKSLEKLVWLNFGGKPSRLLSFSHM